MVETPSAPVEHVAAARPSGLEVYQPSIAWRLFALFGIPGFPLLFRFLETKLASSLTLPSYTILAFNAAQIGTAIGMVFLFAATFEKLTLDANGVRLTTIFGTRLVLWLNLVSYDVNINAGSVDIVGADGTTIHVELGFMPLGTADALSRYLATARQNAFDHIDERGFKSGAKGGFAGAVFAILLGGTFIVGLLLVGRSSPPANLEDKVCYAALVSAAAYVDLAIAFAMSKSASVNASGVTSRSLLGVKTIPFGQILNIRLYVKKYYGGRHPSYRETMDIDGMAGHLTLNADLAGFPLFRDYILSKATAASVDDDRPDSWQRVV